MLIHFKVKNFRSFKDEIEFSMEAGFEIHENEANHIRKVEGVDLLKSAVLFGANASGKSNFIKALESLFLLITEPTKDANELLRTTPFFGNKDNTKYQIEFLKQGSKFLYILELNEQVVVYERLDINEKIHFERTEQAFPIIPGILKHQLGNVRKNQLLLFYSQAQNDIQGITAYTWFNQDLIFADAPMRKTSVFLALRESLRKGSFKEKFLALLKYADFNIVDLDVLESLSMNCGSGERQIHNMWQYMITTHLDESGQPFKMSMAEESEGTKKFILIILELMFGSTTGEKVILFDEFNHTFHLELSQTLLYLINRQKQNNQFILTTHELSLMNCQLKPDQIYFTEKNENGSTHILSLYDFDDPEIDEEKIDHKMRYISGRYGGIPMISTAVLESILEEETDG